MTSKREYLTSKGITVGRRGRFSAAAKQASLIGHIEQIDIAANVRAIILAFTSGSSLLPLPFIWSAVSENHNSGSELPVHNPCSWLYSLFLYTLDLAPLFTSSS